MSKFRVLDYDIIYLSYDEPNAEKNYADLFIQRMGGKNLASSGQTNQEIFETVYAFLLKRLCTQF